MMNGIELKPCPFCGGKAVVDWARGYVRNGRFVDFDNYYAGCRNCEAAIYDFDTAEEAAEAWNTRTEQKGE